MKKTLFALAAAAVALGASAADPYKVIVDTPEGAEGAMGYLINYDTGAKVDSVLFDETSAVFTGEIDEPIVARLLIDSQRYAQFILENGTVKIGPDRRAFGSPLNDEFRAISDSASAIGASYQQAATDAQRDSIELAYNTYIDTQMKANIDNPIGYLLFMDRAYEMQPDELAVMLSLNPGLSAYTRVTKLLEMNRCKAKTGIGTHYADFDINGKKLSDYVGRDGKYLLVDFWASWCGPCKRQMPVLKELYATYPEQLNVLGVAVWDKHDDTLAAIRDHELPWECIIDAGNIPTDIYGISGIPCIMLIAPDGTIVSRDLQGDELKADVARILGAAKN